MTTQKTDHEISGYAVSCIANIGIDTLLAGIEGELSKEDEVISVAITPNRYAVRAWLHQKGDVIHEEQKKSGICEMEVRLTETDAGKLRARHPEVIA